MDIDRSSTFTILYAGRELLSPSHFLLRWTRKQTNVATYCICQNIGNEDGPILLQVTETGAVTPDPFTDPDYSELVNVGPSPLPPPDPVDPCLGCGGGSDCPVDVTVTVNGVVQTPFTFDPCADNTLTLNINYA